MGRLGVTSFGEVRPRAFLRLPADFDRWYQGKRVSEQENMIRGGLKYKWATGISAPRTVEPKAPSTSA